MFLLLRRLPLNVCTAFCARSNCSTNKTKASYALLHAHNLYTKCGSMSISRRAYAYAGRQESGKPAHGSRCCHYRIGRILIWRHVVILFGWFLPPAERCVRRDLDACLYVTIVSQALTMIVRNRAIKACSSTATTVQPLGSIQIQARMAYGDDSEKLSSTTFHSLPLSSAFRCSTQ